MKIPLPSQMRCSLLALSIVEMMVGTVTVAAATPTPTPGCGNTVSLSPQKDNTLYEDPAGQLSNGAGIYLFSGKTNVPTLRRGLVAFDLASIPTNATITGATFSMFLSRTNSSSEAVSLSKVLRDWGEGASDAGDPGGFGVQAEANDATWLHNFYDTSFWTTPGGDFSSVLSATTIVSTVDTIYTWSGSGLLADVQGWVSNPANNFGWVILGNEIDAGSAKRLNTRENSSNPPQLTVTYQVPCGTPAPTPTIAPTPTPTPASLRIRYSSRPLPPVRMCRSASIRSACRYLMGHVQTCGRTGGPTPVSRFADLPDRRPIHLHE